MNASRIFAIVCMVIAIAFAVLAFKGAKFLGLGGARLLALPVLFFAGWAWNCWHDDIDEQDRW